MSTSVDDETILEVLRSNDAPRMTSTEVAGQLPVTQGTTRTRLQALADEGLLRRTTEGNDVVWWLPEREDEFEAAVSGESTATEPVDDESKTEQASGDESSVESESTGSTTAVEVEAVDDTTGETVDVDTTEASSTTDSETERPELSPDDEGFRLAALAAATVVLLLLLRKLLAGGDEAT